MIEIDYAPDFSPHIPGNLVNVSDFVPTVTGSYATSGGPTTEGYSAPSTGNDVVGAAVIKNKSGTARLYAGTRTKLFEANGTTGWTDRSAKAYSTASTGSWEFAQLGDTTYAANGADVLQKASGAAYADTATAPTARSVIIHENALLCFNLSTDAAGWARSDTGSDTFTVTAGNDADSGTFLQGSGPITAATTFGSLALAFKGDIMYSGRFVGDVDEKVRWDTVARVGCAGQHAHVSTELGVIFVSNRDILLFDGSSPRSIADKVRRSFFANLSPSQRANVYLTHDEVDRVIYIWYPVSGSGVNYPTSALAYNYRSGKWGRVASISSASTTYSHIRCPVKGANYTDYTAVGGMSTNSNLSANVVFATTSGGDGKLVNYARGGSATRSGAPVIATGWFGQADRDTTLTGLYVVPEKSTWSLAIASGLVVTLDQSLNGTSGFFNTTPTIHNGRLEFTAEGRFHQASVTWTSGSASDTEIRGIVPMGLRQGGNR